MATALGSSLTVERVQPEALALWVDHMLARMRSEYREMPGLRLTLPQARRLFGLSDISESICQTLLDVLVEEGFLCRTPSGYRRRAYD